MKKRILLVDDDADINFLLGIKLNKHRDDHVDYASCAETALVKLSIDKYDLVITDYNMPGGMNGAELFRKISKFEYSIPVILLSGDFSLPESERLLEEGLFCYMEKDRLISGFAAALEVVTAALDGESCSSVGGVL